MSLKISERRIREVSAFHGHLCPGLAIGMRVGEAAQARLGSTTVDEEAFCIAETTNCAIDAIQFITHCTLGKGNLFIRDYGRNSFIFARRDASRGWRITVRDLSTLKDPGQVTLQADVPCFSEAKVWAILCAPEAEILDINKEEIVLPSKAQIRPLVRCASCGQLIRDTAAVEVRGHHLCIPCLRQELTKGVLLKPIGYVHNDLLPGKAAPCAKSDCSTIEIDTELAEGLTGIDRIGYLDILFGFHLSPAKPALLQHRRGDRSRPLEGVFALRSSYRPNPIGLTTVRLLRRDGNALLVEGLDAWNGSPVYDIKPTIRQTAEQGPEEPFRP